MQKVIEWLGWYGVVAIVSAYALVSFSVLPSNSVWYQLLNGTGAIGIVIESWNKRAYQPAVLNVIWTVIAVISMVRMIAQ
jgi:hypothetical protein